MNWRLWNRALHRDLGYLCLGLTVVYALSGIAVNHLRDWNPSYRVERVVTQIEPSSYRGVVNDAMVQELLRRVGEASTYDNIFQADPESVMIFVEGRRLSFHLPSGQVELERVTPRAFWHPLNFLHLNHPKKAWTWIADLYAAGLLLLALSGLLMLPRNHQRMRCLYLFLLGVAVPVAALLYYYNPG